MAAIALAVLGGVLYWSNRREAAKAEAGGTPDAPRIINLKQEDIRQINILRGNGQKITLAKHDSGEWWVEEKPPLPGDFGVISGLLSSLSKLDSERIVEEKPANLSAYGLAQPAVQAEVITKSGQSKKLLLGDNTPAGSSTFAMVEADPRLFTISSYVKTSLDKAPPDFADKKLFSFGFDFPPKVDMRIGAKTYHITFMGDDWKLDDKKMDATSMQSVIARIRDLEGTGFTSTGFGKPDIEFTVTPANGRPVEHAVLSKSGDHYIARHDGVEAMYIISDEMIKDLEKYVGQMKPYTPPPAEATTSATPASPAAPAASAPSK